MADGTKSDKLITYGASAVPDRTRPLCVDLFAGAGGLAVGFRAAGWTVIGANDRDRDASATFRLNFPEAVFFEGAIWRLEADDVLRECGIESGELDCMIGGPPCQSFSYNNHQRSDSDDRARLFEHYLRLVRGLRPKVLVMENVPGILTIGNGGVVTAIRAELKLMGYESAIDVLSAEEFGTPQMRRRVFIVATRIGDPRTLLPAVTHRSADTNRKNKKPPVSAFKPAARLKKPVTVNDAIGDLPAIANGGGQRSAGRMGVDPFTGFQREARRGARKVLNHICHALTKVNTDRIVHVPEGGNWRNIPRELLPAGMQRAKLSDHTKRYGRLARTGLASTLLTKCDPHWGAYVHPTQDRTISVREAARLQGFPDSFEFDGNNLGAHYEQVGNAVPVPVARAIGRVAVAHLNAVLAVEAEPTTALEIAGDYSAQDQAAA